MPSTNITRTPVSHGRNELLSYGFVHVPTVPGMHELECSTWRPAGTTQEEYRAEFLGVMPHLRNDHLVHEPSDRFRLVTTTMGHVHINVGVLVKDFKDFGVEL